jgi:hypothetical protein
LAAVEDIGARIVANQRAGSKPEEPSAVRFGPQPREQRSEASPPMRTALGDQRPRASASWMPTAETTRSSDMASIRS